MKIKNSYILIVIAIFLLISIGSVCASENITDDSDIQLDDDGTDVVLSDTDENVPDETAQEPINTTVETDKDKYEFKQDSNKTFSVQVKDNNKSSPIDVNKSALSILNGNKNVSFEYTGSIVTITEALPIGNYNLTVNYLGNENYINSTKVIAVKIYGNSTIETVTSVVCDGVNIEIPVNVYDQVENITLIKDNFNLTLVYTNETGNVSNLTIRNFTIEDGKIKFATPVELINASLIINYANATEPKTVGIKISTEVKVATDKDKYRSEEIKNISITILDGQGNPLNVTKNDLKVFDNGANITFEYNNSVITLDLKEGVHNLTFAYQGNETYNASSSEIVIKVSGNNTINVPKYVVCNESTVEIPFTIFDGSENINATHNFTLTLTYNNETGSIASKNITEYQINDGKIIFTIENTNTINANVIIDYVNSTGAKTVKINLPSKIEAIPDVNKYRFNETNNITVNVTDSLGNKLNIAKNDLKVFDNGKEIAFTFDNTTSIINVKLTEGVHNVTVTYVGNDTYNSSSTTIEQKVYGDIKFNPDTVAVLDRNNQVTITINLNDGADLVNITQSKLNITVFYTLDNITKNTTVTYELDGQNVTFDMDADFDSAYAVITYAENNLTATTQIKVNTVITVQPSEIIRGESENKTIRILVDGTNDHIINITKDNLQILKDGKALNIEINESFVTIKDAFKFGVYNLTVKYLGGDTYLGSVENITMIVYGINATTSTNINSSKKGEIKFDVISGNESMVIDPDSIQIKVTYKNGNDTVVINVTDYRYDNKTLYFTLENANFTTATMNLKYDYTEANVTLNRIYNAKIEIITGINEYKTGNYTFRLVDVDDGSNITGKTFRLTTTGNLRAGFTTTTNSEGIASFKTANLYTFDQTGSTSLNMKEFEVGTYEVDLETEGNVKSTKVTTNLTVVKANIKIVIDSYKEYYGSSKNVTMSVKNSLNEPMAGMILKLTIDGLSGTYYLSTDKDGVGQIAIYSKSSKSGLVGGDYVFHVSNNDTKNINKTSAKKTITVLKIATKISAKDVTVKYNSGTTATIKVTNKKTGKAVSGMYILVRLYSTSKKYNDYLFQTNKKGKISFSASLAVGKHKMVVSSADNRYSASKVTKTITVKKAKAKITAKKVKAYYKGGKYLTVKLTNTQNKKPIYDGKLSIKVFVSKNRYYNFKGNTGLNGKLRLSLDNFKPGTYKVVVSSASKKNFEAKKVTTKIVIKKANAKLTPKKLTAKKGAKKYFKVTVKNKKTKKVIKGAKLKIKVYTGKKAKTFKVKTNKKGVAKISTKKLKVGKHKVVVTSANKYIKAKKAKSTIKIKK